MVRSSYLDQDKITQFTQLAELLNQAGVYIFAKDNSDRYTYVNEAVCKFYQAALPEILGQKADDFLDVGLAKILREGDRRVLQQGQELLIEEELVVRKTREKRVFWAVRIPLRDAGGDISGLFGMSIDITDRRNIIDRIGDHNQLLNTVLSNIDAAIYMKSCDGKYLYANHKTLELYGCSLNDIIGRVDHDLMDKNFADPLVAMDKQVFESGLRKSKEEKIVGVDGAEHSFWSIKVPIKLPGQKPVLVGFSSEITELLQLKDHLEYQRVTDNLTGLPNQIQFEQSLQMALDNARCSGHKLAILLIDFDQFKYVNNALGYESANEIIKEAAKRLNQCDWLSGSLARFSGDDFAILIAQPESDDEVALVAERLRLMCSEPYRVAGQVFHLTASVGISTYPADGDLVSQLIKHAESAMYHAKDQGRDQIRFYSTELSEAVSDRMHLERDLRAALVEQQFELYYQPKIGVTDKQVAGVEALIRWNRPMHGFMSPALFIPLAESLGLINQIGDWVIEAACQQLSAWSTQGLGEVQIAINLSPGQLTSTTFLERVRLLIAQYAVKPNMLEMEVTESMMMHNPEKAISTLQALRELDIQLYIDDFGTGFSSMSYLKRLPVNALKLDRSFIINIATAPRDADVCEGIIELAHKLGLNVVAEGVETQEQYDALAERSCDIVQGYLYSHPLPIEKATRFLLAH